MEGNQVESKCSVKGKVKCIYQPNIISLQSGKRNNQMYKVVASNKINEDFAKHIKVGSLNATEKLDGTCCLIAEFYGRPWLWARHDVKPNKQADKRFKAYKNTKNEYMIINGNDEKYPEFIWDLENDFKEAPDEWIPAAIGVTKHEAIPDDIGHIVGWVPVDTSLRSHLWHLSAVKLNNGIGLFLNHMDNGKLKICVQKLEKYIGKTFELIGTHVNANPYGLGCKKNPVHVLVQHGELPIKTFPDSWSDITHDDLKAWFNEHIDGKVEGIVWHADDGKMFKLHRHHLDLVWPIQNVRISTLSIDIDMSDYDRNEQCTNNLFEKLKDIDGKTFENVSELFKDNSIKIA